MKCCLLFVMKQFAPPPLCSVDCSIVFNFDCGDIASQEVNSRKCVGTKMRSSDSWVGVSWPVPCSNGTEPENAIGSGVGIISGVPDSVG